MEIQGTIKSILPVEEGTSKAGKTWKKQNFVLDVPGKYPKQICFTCFGKVVDALDYCKEGQCVVVHFDVSSREYNGRWFTEASAWKIEKEGGLIESSNENENVEKKNVEKKGFPQSNADVQDDLPF
jgi:hypothetical protein